MAQIFVSHSRKDGNIRDFFDRAFAGSSVKAVRVEFEEAPEPASQYIAQQIKFSDAIFVLLGPNIVGSSYTQNWVAFEIGLAAAYEYAKHIWVFEPKQYEGLDFPVPFLHHFVVYDLYSEEDFRYIQDIVRAYEPILPIFRNIPRGYDITCPYEDCQSSYILHAKTQRFYCPVCRRPVELTNEPLTEG